LWSYFDIRGILCKSHSSIFNVFYFFLSPQKVVISAAHCVTAITVDQVLLYIGRYDIKSVINTDGYQERGAQQLICHPDYYKPDRSFSDADVALVLMSTPVSYTKYILPICLWPVSMANQNVVAKRGIVAGWGRDESGAGATSEPHVVELPVVSSTQCLQEDISYFYITSNRTLCAGEKNGKGPCNGDSGSGFVIKQGGKWMLRGVVSAGLPDPVKLTCDLTKYIVLSDVTKFNDWILSYLSI
jgi:secreted trypsin-like serine protease